MPRCHYFHPWSRVRGLLVRSLATLTALAAAVTWAGIVAAPATASPALVQHASKDAGSTLSSSLAFRSSNTAGNWIGVVIRAGQSGQVFTVSDTRRNIYQKAVQFNQTLDTPNGDTFAIFYAENIIGGANTVTVSDTISNKTLRFAILEYSGVATTNSLDVTAAAQGTGTSANSGNATTAAGNLVLGAVMTANTAAYTAGSGFTIEEHVPAEPNTKLIAEDRIQTVTGGIAATARLSSTNSWGAAVAAFKPAAGGGTTPIITNLNPASGPVNSLVTIKGMNFGTAQLSSTVTFNGTAAAAPAPAWSPTSITVNVPAIAAGNSTVVVTVGGLPSNGAAFTVTVPTIVVTVSPKRSGVTVTQPLALTAGVQNDSSNSGVTWSTSGGALSNQTISSATFTATVAGVYTITATSKADVTKSASAVVGVTDLSAVSTWRNDASHSGVNSQEYALTPLNVRTATFGKLFSCPVDGYVPAQPLWVANVSISGTPHNVVFVATENDSLYALDADHPGCKSVWSAAKVGLIPGGEVVARPADLQGDTAAPTVGITGTPVIDPASQTIYLVALSKNSTTNEIIHRLHAIDITTGQERPHSPVVIAASVNGTGYDNSSGTITFAAKMQKQRTAVLLLNGLVYVSFAGFRDTDFYHGWLMGYDASTLNLVTVFNDTIDGGRGGIWMSGGGPAADSLGNIYLLTGNGDFNANTTGGRNYGDTFLKLGTSGGLSVSDWFTPFDQSYLNAHDLDLGGGGAVILLDYPSSPVPHLVLGGGKAGTLYVLNRDSLGHFKTTDNSEIVQSFSVGANGIFSTPLFWQNTLYAAADGTPLGAYPFSPVTDQFQTSPSSVSNQTFSYSGTTPTLSAAGTANAILWAVRRTSETTPGVLHAYDPANLKTEFWNSSQAAGGRDLPGNAVHFTSLTVANGKVYLGTQTELDVYGLLPN